MKPIAFPQANVVFAKDQPEYIPLPAHRAEDGTVVTCWSLSWRERLRVLLDGKIWLSTLTFNQPVQPQLPDVRGPFCGEG